MTSAQDDGRDPAPSAPLAVGYVAGAHGIHGRLRVQLHDPDSDALKAGRRVMFRRGDAIIATHVLKAAAPVPGKVGRYRVDIAELSRREDVEALKGCTLLIERAELPALAEDEFYLADAIGLPVLRQSQGETQALGTIVGLTSNGAQDLFEVKWRAPDGRAHVWLLPVLPQMIVALDEHRVVVDLPQGMLPDPLEAEG